MKLEDEEKTETEAETRVCNVQEVMELERLRLQRAERTKQREMDKSRVYKIHGQLRITAVCGNKLPALDSNGLSDPYLRLIVAGKTFKTSVRHKTLEPVWNEEFVWADVAMDDVLHVLAYDADALRGLFSIFVWFVLSFLSVEPLSLSVCDFLRDFKLMVPWLAR